MANDNDQPNPNTPLQPIEDSLSDELTAEEKRAIDENIERFLAGMAEEKERAAMEARKKWQEEADAEKAEIMAEIAAEQAEQAEKLARAEKEKTRWTAEQIHQCARSMLDTLSPEEADAIYDRLFDALGEDSLSDLCGSDAVGAELKRLEEQARLNAKTKAQVKAVEKEEAQREKRAKRKGKPFKRARRVSRSPETWRHLKNYPGYEISSHGRVRSLDRARPDDWLKPRRKWFRGMGVEWVVIYDNEGKRRERMVSYLLVDAGFMPRPTWMKG